jgi:hypothetical protein
VYFRSNLGVYDSPSTVTSRKLSVSFSYATFATREYNEVFQILDLYDEDVYDGFIK